MLTITDIGRTLSEQLKQIKINFIYKVKKLNFKRRIF